MLLIGSASAARTHGRKDPEQLYAYTAEADNIHDTLLPILKAQLAEIMSVPTPLVTSKHKVTHYAHAQHGPGFKIRQITGSIVQGALLCGMGPTGKGCSHLPANHIFGVQFAIGSWPLQSCGHLCVYFYMCIDVIMCMY